ncbi:MAG: hypothetical protein QOH46_1814 [Solirubrobacteraceae bacterium]|jgi:hypothetical protein|nr:hypothetical protein [Solirubrobacteraceae bacterium]
MDDRRFRPLLEAMIESVGTRTDAQAEQLTTALGNRCWPGGSSDHTVPTGRDWVRRWGPRRLGPVALHCSCAQGRCRLCN